jgi:hypothetical protein
VDVIESLVTAVGPLAGVFLGGWLAQRQELQTWHREQQQQLRKERLDVFSRFITAARTWQSNVLEPSASIVTAHTGTAYADGGEAFGQAIRALAEIRLIAGWAETIEAAVKWDQSLRSLSEARATVHPAPAPRQVIDLVISNEYQFMASAKVELAATVAPSRRQTRSHGGRPSRPS